MIWSPANTRHDSATRVIHQLGSRASIRQAHIPVTPFPKREGKRRATHRGYDRSGLSGII